jgi:hypothetical protein
MTSSAPDRVCREVNNNLLKSQQPAMQNLQPEFLLHLQKQCEDSVMMLPSSQEATVTRKYLS